MGAWRIQEVNMLALVILLLSVVILLAVAGRIWIGATPLDSRETDSAAVNDSGETVTRSKLSGGGGPVS